jgi:hypothetical protein
VIVEDVFRISRSDWGSSEGADAEADASRDRVSIGGDDMPVNSESTLCEGWQRCEDCMHIVWIATRFEFDETTTGACEYHMTQVRNDWLAEHETHLQRA